VKFRVLTRREFVQLTAGTAGGIAFGIAPTGLAVESAARESAQFTAWIVIHADDRVELVCPLADMGQGIHQSLPLIVAEELDADWSKVVVRLADADTAYRNPNNLDKSQGSGSSLSVRGYFEVLRKAGAAARELLVSAAAENWGVSADECRTALSTVSHIPSGQRVRYGELVGQPGFAEQLAKKPFPENPRLKIREEFRLIGRRQVRKDLPAKVTGSNQFGVDIRTPGMLAAVIRHAPTAGGKLVSFREPDLAEFPGLVAIVRADDASIAAVAGDYWTAERAVAACDVTWTANSGFDTKTFEAELAAGVSEPGKPWDNIGDVPGALASAAEVVEARYSVPMLAHATMEPMSCAADVRPGRCEVWAPSQNVERVRKRIAGTLDLALEAVTIHHTWIGGAFGRRIEQDFVMQAVEISRQVARPVRLIWSREEDIRNDFFRAGYVADFRGGLDDTGKPVAWHARSCGPSIYDERAPGRFGDRADPTSVGGLAPHIYTIPNRRSENVPRPMPLHTGFWRSVSGSMNFFFSESFMDELALAAGSDPYEYRRSLLETGSRARAVLEAAGVNWARTTGPGKGRGIAVDQGYGSYSAVSISVSMDGDNLSIDEIRVSVDPGLAIDPDNIEMQIEGGVIYGLTAALFGEITVTDGVVDQSNFHDYRALRLAEIPPIVVELVASDSPPGGIGEVGTPLIAPALCNAIHAATGRRIRDLPLSRAGITLA
jgi:isoquinoline 1-oxidoreductase beta subunit